MRNVLPHAFLLFLLALLAVTAGCGEPAADEPALSATTPVLDTAPARASGPAPARFAPMGLAPPAAAEVARALSGTWSSPVATTDDVCYVKWSDLYWDPVARTHYVWFTNGCPVAYYCYVNVTRSSGTNKYGWCVSGNSSYRIDVGIVEEGDKVVPGVGDEC